MSWSIRLGRLLGIDIYVHLTFFLLLAWIVFAQYQRSGDWRVALAELVFVLLIFVIITMHEYGHALMARRFGVKTHDITLLPIGGVARLEKIPQNPVQEFLIAIAGPAVNVALAILCFLYLLVANPSATLSSDVIPDNLLQVSLMQRLMLLNIWLVIFNAIPAFPMDGGRVLRSLLAMLMPYDYATRVAASIGQMIAFGFVLLGLLIPGGWPLLLIALFVWMGAAQEANVVSTQAQLAGVPVRYAMISDFRVATPHDTLYDVARHVLAGFQHDFPVVDQGKVVGIITRSALLTGLAERGRETPVAEVMDREFLTADPSEMLNDAFLRLQECKGHSLPVIENGHLVGLLTAENVGEFLMIRSAVRQGMA